MRKLAMFGIVLGFLTTLASAQELEGVYGLKFGEAASQADAALRAKGLVVTSASATNPSYGRGVFAGIPIQGLSLSFFGDKLVLFLVSVSPLSEDMVVPAFHVFAQKIQGRYPLAKRLELEGDSDQLLRSWAFSGNRTITLSRSRENTLTLLYQAPDLGPTQDSDF